MKEDEELESAVILIAGATAGLTDSEDPRITINSGGVGCNLAEEYVNGTFAIRDFC